MKILNCGWGDLASANTSGVGVDRGGETEERRGVVVRLELAPDEDDA